MRARGHDGPFSVHAIAGTHVVLFGIDLAADATNDLLGFALHRTDRATNEAQVLPNFLRLKANVNNPGPSGTDANPVQAFVWCDYAAWPEAKLCYRLEARYLTATGLESRYTVELDVDVEAADDGRHGIFFNRGAAGSQAYARKFHDADPRHDAAAQAWLSRGLEEALLGFIAQATGPGFVLRGAFYEFHQAHILQALAAAAARGVDVQLVVARPHDAKTGHEKAPSSDNVDAVKSEGLEAHVRWRTHSTYIPHNKFLVLLENGEPQAVWTGSTNITDGALWGQSNLGHLVHQASRADVAPAYLAYWHKLADDVDTDTLQRFNDETNPVPDGAPPGNAVGTLFSPHTGEGALHWLAARMSAASNSVFFTAPFGVSKTLEDVLLAKHPFAVYALLEGDDNNMSLLRASGDNQVVSGAYLGKGPWHQFLLEALTGLNPMVQYIHTKYLLVDPLSDDPLVVTGSANFSGASVAANDENMLIIRGDTRVADIYLTEFMRLFTHMYFRQHVATATSQPSLPARPMAEMLVPTAQDPVPSVEGSELFLCPDDSWTAAWFAPGSHKSRERELFA